MSRSTRSILLLTLVTVLCLLAWVFPSSIPRAVDVTLTPESFVYLPFIAQPALPTSTSTATLTLTPTATPTSTSTSTATLTLTPTATSTRPAPPTGTNVRCVDFAADVQVCAWVSNGNPAQYGTVTVYGRLISAGVPIANAPMHTVWHYKTTTQTEDCVTGSDGIGRCSRSIGAATKGYTVSVNVTITYQGSSYGTSTWFTPQ